jgi:hypothetical protein
MKCGQSQKFLLPIKDKKIVPPAKEYAFTLAKIVESYSKDGTVDTRWHFAYTKP